MNKILIVDDEKPLRDALVKWFRRDYECLVAPDGEAALELIQANDDIALLITDERMPGMNGSELLRKAKELRPAMSVIMLTAYGSMELAVEAMRNGGADDFYQKPVTDLNAFALCIERAVQKSQLKREVVSLKNEVATLKAESDAELENFTGRSPAMERIYRLIRKVAPSEATVLIQGPSGTGKELVASALHRLSARAQGPFVAVECAAYAAGVLEAELFGSVKGGYTDARDRQGCFERANGGTLFLDEIGEIEESVQIKLLRVLQEHTLTRVGGEDPIKVDFRLVAATNKDLAALVRAGKFREDLFYRLNVIDLHLPALRERQGDIALLAARFLKEFAAQYASTVSGIEPAAMKQLEDYEWPGNVRQLRNVIEKMVVLASGDKLTVEDLPVEITAPKPAAAPLPPPPAAAPLPAARSRPDDGETLAATEKRQILAAIAAAGNNKSQAANALGISRRTLHRKLKEWGMN